MIIGRLVASSLLVSAFVVAADPPSPFTPTQRKYWAFQPVRRAELPSPQRRFHACKSN